MFCLMPWWLWSLLAVAEFAAVEVLDAVSQSNIPEPARQLRASRHPQPSRAVLALGTGARPVPESKEIAWKRTQPRDVFAASASR